MGLATLSCKVQVEKGELRVGRACCRRSLDHYKNTNPTLNDVCAQRYQRHHGGHAVAAHHKSSPRPEGAQLQAVGNPLVPGEGSGRQASHQPPDHLPAAGRLQPAA